ncbi:putative ankyrin repeat-containing domain superfamily [Helianthus annuus]|nr:putative ankyrin repeat-containing domain superfamily [Helianthus annuus]KAJ0564330.1 putative ankyrin repeat-containing domain superfamily [Helianthus annuus]KAJ0909297.1 putative ankyrin repeat-containing domain superfamily [Helianthus annuus]
MMPLYVATLYGNKDVVKYMYNHSNNLRDGGWMPLNRGWLLLKCVENDMFDVALKIVTTRSVLEVLARKPEAFREMKLNVISRTIRWGKNLYSEMLSTPQRSQIENPEVEFGNREFVVELIWLYPDLIWKVDENNQSIFHVAVAHRHEGIYNLLYEIGSMKDLISPLRDRNDNNMLHLVGKCAKQKRLEDVSGVALKVQRELLWFKLRL